MSNQLCGTAKLRRHHGPFYPSNLARLQEILYTGRVVCDKTFCLAMASELGVEFSHLDRSVITEDGYEWQDGIVFFFGQDLPSVTVLFPQVQDNDLDDGTQSDRSIALYGEVEIDDSYLGNFVDRLCDVAGIVAQKRPAVAR